MISSKNRLIFCYHDISDKNSPQYSEFYSTTPKNFQTQVEFIIEHFEIVSLDEIVSTEKKHNKRLACLTFDDGFLSVKKNALPFLESLGITFAVFANKKAVENNRLNYDSKFFEMNRKYGEKVYMDKNDLCELNEKNILIGSHSTSHKVLAECDDRTLREEIIENKLFLENITGRNINHFALPYGKREHYNRKVLDLCFSSGHEYVYSTNPVCFNSSILQNEDKLIPRLGVTNQSVGELCFLINRPLFKKIDI